MLLKIEMAYFNLINQALDKQALHEFEAATDYDFYKELAKPGFLHLSSLSVSPKHQRKGIGKALVEVGMGIAATEQIPVTLEASMTGQRMYSALGFVVIEKHEIIEGFDGIAMLWEPPALKGRWLDRYADNAAKLKKTA
jgi:ribosomal protein S18 acetylase RimI-like enzyme